MKRVGNVYDELTSRDNIELADRKARKNKRKSYGVVIHDRNRDNNISDLQTRLVSQSFRTSEYEVRTIYEPKERVLHKLPYFPDRITHHAIMNICEDIWVRVFSRCSYSCIKGRGIHACAEAVKRTLRKFPDPSVYCLKIDIRKFYDSISHVILMNILKRKIKDSRLLSLLSGIIESVKKGVPIGNYLSQFFANLYLSYFDHWIKEVKKVRHYFRYADDMVFLGKTKRELQRLLNEIRVYLKTNLNLKIKRNYQVFPVEKRGIDFVGYVFYHRYTRLRKSIKVRYCRRIARLNRMKTRPPMEVYRSQLASWFGWSIHCNSINLQRKTIKLIPYEISFRHTSGSAA